MDGNVYISDSNNHRIRFIPRVTGTYFGQPMTADSIYTIAGTGTGGFNSDNVVATSAQLNGPQGLCVDVAGNVSVADYTNHRIRYIPKMSGIHFGQTMIANNIYTIAGTGVWGASGDGGIATAAKIHNPSDVDMDESGNLFIADRSNHRIRVIANTSGTYFGQLMTANSIYTIAGTGTSAYGGDGGVEPGSTPIPKRGSASI
ncbi:MAG: hypothetical protein IPN90_12955 [Elusimicrobia bacterium]|nr:hypothetical protein [Elusimicrobiota bacterium]